MATPTSSATRAIDSAIISSASAIAIAATTIWSTVTRGGRPRRGACPGAAWAASTWCRQSKDIVWRAAGTSPDSIATSFSVYETETRLPYAIRKKRSVDDDHADGGGGPRLPRVRPDGAGRAQARGTADLAGGNRCVCWLPHYWRRAGQRAWSSSGGTSPSPTRHRTPSLACGGCSWPARSPTPCTGRSSSPASAGSTGSQYCPHTARSLRCSSAPTPGTGWQWRSLWNARAPSGPTSLPRWSWPRRSAPVP